MAAKKDTTSASHNVSDCQFSTINFNGYHLLVMYCAECAPNKFSTMINLTKKLPLENIFTGKSVTYQYFVLNVLYFQRP